MSTSAGSAEATAAPSQRRVRTTVLDARLLLSEYLVLLLTVLYFLVMWPIVPEIAAADTLLDILASMMPLLVVAIGQTFVLIVAGIDLSAPSIIAMASVVGASVMTRRWRLCLRGPRLEIPVGILAFLVVGWAIGAFNGLCTTRFDMPSFIVTLTTMMFFSGAAIWFTATQTDASSIGNLPPGFIAIGQGTVAGMPYLAVGRRSSSRSSPISSSTRTRLWPLALCGRRSIPRAAAVSGVPVRRVIFWAFVISGVCAAIASVIYTGRLETGTPVLGQRILLDVIGAAVIGGVSLFGGKGKIIWTVFGVLFLTVIDKSLQLLGLSLASVFAIKGGDHPARRGARRAAPSLSGARLTLSRRQPMSSATGVPLLAVEGICKSFFGVEVLHEVGFALEAGQVLGLVGENGSGKSTTMNIIGGVHQMDPGAMLLDGRPYAPRGPARRRGAAASPSSTRSSTSSATSPSRRTCSSPAFPSWSPACPSSIVAPPSRRPGELLAAVDLDSRRRRRSAACRQGERQLVEIAKALGAKARIIIFDEPTTSLTARETERLFDIIDRLQAARASPSSTSATSSAT